MISIQCEKCNAPLQLDDQAVPSEGLKGRCGKCGHVFTISPQNSDADTKQPESDSLSDLIMASADDLAENSTKEMDAEKSVSEPPTETVAESNSYSPSGFQVTEEVMQKYQTKVRQSFKRSSEDNMGAKVTVSGISKREITRNTAVFFVISIILFFLIVAYRVGSFHPKAIWLSINHGQIIRPQQLNIIDYKPIVFQTSYFQDYMTLKSILLNPTGGYVQSGMVSFSFFDAQGNLLSSLEYQCCEKAMGPFTRLNIDMDLNIPTRPSIGSYSIKISP
ncbi:MAG: zinc-ribbon domain-containing protein [Bdellovibrionales bacterium]|nr:zinc-ribbon domain-containing protein [Bdellovibrionales bacterium]